MNQPIFFISNPIRSKQFIVETRILKNAAGQAFAEKTATHPEGKTHLLQMLKTYEHLQSLNELPKHVNVVQASRHNDAVRFNFVEGMNVERLLVDAIVKEDFEAASAIIDKLVRIVKALPVVRINPTKNKDYVSVFGDSYNQVCECAQIGLLDLNLDNFISDKKGKWHFYDYEWVFSFPTPKDLLIERFFYWFLLRYKDTLLYQCEKSQYISITNELVMPEPLYKKYKKHIRNMERIQIAENSFRKYANGDYAAEKPIMKLHKQPVVASMQQLDNIDSILSQAKKSEELRLQLDRSHAESLKQREFTTKLEEELNKLKIAHDGVIHSRSYKLAKKMAHYAKPVKTIPGVAPALKTGLRALRKTKATQHAYRQKIADKKRALLMSQDLAKILRGYFGYKKPSTLDKNKIKLGLVMRSGTIRPQSSAFIRLIAPLTHPSVQDKIAFRLFDDRVKGTENVDVFIVQRTAFNDRETANLFVNNVKGHNKKLILDLDDALGHLDKNHPQHAVQYKSILAMKYVIKNVDQLWCSTKEIGDMYATPAQKITVLPNSVDTRLWSMTKPASKKPTDPLRIVYMGTATHNNDLAMILPILDEIHAVAPGAFKVSVIGVSSDIPAKPYIENLQPPADSTIYPRFVEWFSRQGPFDVGLSPLENSEFNRGKSDIKCLDYLSLGMIPVVSDIEPYAKSDLRPFITIVGNQQEDWVRAVTELIKDNNLLKRQKSKVIAGQKYIRQHRLVMGTTEKICDALDI